MEHYSKYTQVIPKPKEVVDYFTSNGSTQEEAFFWLNSMDRKMWKDSKGNKIMEWSKIAWLKIQDLKNKEPLAVIKNSKKDASFLIAEKMGTLFQRQTSKIPTHYIKAVLELIHKCKVENNLQTDLELIRFADKKLAECDNWEYDSVKSFLFQK